MNTCTGVGNCSIFDFVLLDDANKSWIASKDLPLVSGIQTISTIIVKQDKDPKRK